MFLFHLAGSRLGQTSSPDYFVVRVNAPARIGECVVSPTTGVSLVDLFNVSCFGTLDEIAEETVYILTLDPGYRRRKFLIEIF